MNVLIAATAGAAGIEDCRDCLAALFPSGHDSWVRNARRHFGSLISRPVMRSKERRWLASAP